MRPVHNTNHVYSCTLELTVWGTQQLRTHAQACAGCEWLHVPILCSKAAAKDVYVFVVVGRPPWFCRWWLFTRCCCERHVKLKALAAINSKATGAHPRRAMGDEKPRPERGFGRIGAHGLPPHTRQQGAWTSATIFFNLFDGWVHFTWKL